MDRGDLAKEYFLKGYNCSQAIVLAFLTARDLTSIRAQGLLPPSAEAWGVCERFAVRSAVC